MLSFLPPWARGSVSLLLVLLNTLVCCALVYVVSLLRLPVPLPVWKRACEWVLLTIGDGWVGFNNLVIRVPQRIQWDVRGAER